MKNGFTLVELSIVLVIIGLLIGGILVGQSLVGSAQVNRFVSDIGQYNIAVIQFNAKFKSIPGDSPSFTPPGDGKNNLGSAQNSIGLTSSCASSPNTTLSNDEREFFWAHLSQAKMLSVEYAPYSPATSCGGVHPDEYGDESLAGVVWPYTEVNPEIIAFTQSTPSIGGRMISPQKGGPSSSLSLVSILEPLDTLAVEKKTSARDVGAEEGMVNNIGLGNCVNSSLSIVACNDPDAFFGGLAYFPENLVFQ